MTVSVEVAAEGEVATEAEHVFDMQISEVDGVISSSINTNTTSTETTSKKARESCRESSVLIIATTLKNIPASYSVNVFVDVGFELEADLAFSSCVVIVTSQEAVIAGNEVGVSYKHVA